LIAGAFRSPAHTAAVAGVSDRTPGKKRKQLSQLRQNARSNANYQFVGRAACHRRRRARRCAKARDRHAQEEGKGSTFGWRPAGGGGRGRGRGGDAGARRGLLHGRAATRELHCSSSMEQAEAPRRVDASKMAPPPAWPGRSWQKPTTTYLLGRRC